MSIQAALSIEPQCPKCGSDDVRYDDDHDEEGNIEQAWYTCESCGFQWWPRRREGDEVSE